MFSKQEFLFAHFLKQEFALDVFKAEFASDVFKAEFALHVFKARVCFACFQSKSFCLRDSSKLRSKMQNPAKQKT